jgi:hypothetical protein
MMKPFLDSGFLLTLLLKTSGSPKAWEMARRLEGPISLPTFQIFTVDNRLQREIEAPNSTGAQRAIAANALQNFRWYLDQQVFRPIRLDYDIAIDLAFRWQKQSNAALPALLLLWPALAATIGATHFLSFDARTRQLATAAGLKSLPDKL